MPSRSSKTPSPEEERAFARAVACVLSALLGLGVITCTGARRAPGGIHRPPPPVTTSREASPAGPEEVTPYGGSGGARGATSPAPALDAPPSLARFRESLARLARGEATQPLRILWLGDSHTAADFLPDAVRRPLSERAGNGGPGFLYLALSQYRHAGVKLLASGEWTVHPGRPALTVRQEDGVFGLGGVRATPGGLGSDISVTPAKETIVGETKWDLAYRGRSSRDRLTIVLLSGEELEARGDEVEPEKIRHLEWRTPKPGPVTLKASGGELQLFGLTVEASTPGVVIDTVGLNGARMGTPLAWDAGSWLAEATRRAPALVILAYGTNDVGDPGSEEARAREVHAVVERVRAIQPQADCLLMGPTDRAGPGWTLVPGVREVEGIQRRVAESAGCAFFSAVDAMGGDGGIKRWAELTPPLATSDRVHLTLRGYAKLGASLSTFLLGETVVPDL